jgi:gliding motility-associated-like protein
MKVLPLLTFFVLFSFTSFSQLDSVFWFVAPEVAQSHGDRPIVFRFATLAAPATISVSQPANPNFPIQTINIAANSAQTLDLTPWIDMVENKPANTTLNYGFKILSSTKITAYYEVNPTCNCNPDIFALKGKNALGTSFITPFQNYLNNASYARSGFNIVATENNTSIVINPTQNIIGHVANVPFTITLNVGETYYAEASSTSAGSHLSGSSVISNKPIAVTLSDDTAEGTPYGGCADLMGDQLIPTTIIGKEYIALKGYLNGPDKLYIVGVTNGTQISIDGTLVTTINAAQTYVHTLSNPAVYIETSSPAYVLHQSGFGCEVGEAILPPIVCTGSNTVAFVRSTNEFFAVNLLVPTGGETSFLFNGAPGVINPASFNFVPGTNNEWKYAQIDASSFTTALQSSRIENAAVKFHMGLIHGGSSSGCRYGYFSDFATLRYQIQSSNETVCQGDSIVLQTNELPGATYTWTGPNNFTFQGSTLTIQSAQLVNAGQYQIAGNNPDACELLPDTLTITVIPTPASPIIYSNNPVCLSDTVTFWYEPTNNQTYSWTDNQGNPLVINDTLIFLNEPLGTITVNLTTTNQGCVSPPSSLTATVIANPVIQYTGTTAICGNEVDFSATATPTSNDPVSVISWYKIPSNQEIGNGSTLQNVISTNNPYALESYFAEVTSENGCVGYDTFQVTFHPFPVVDFAYLDLCDGSNVSFTNTTTWNGTPSSSDNVTYDFAFGDNTSSQNLTTTHDYQGSGTFTATIVGTSAFGCVDTIFKPIVILPIPESVISVVELCGQTANFSTTISSGNLNITSYNWSVPSIFQNTQSSFNYTFASGGTYNGELILSASNGCDYEYPFNFVITPKVELPELQIPNIITSNNDGINDEIVIDAVFEECFEYELKIFNRWGSLVYTMKSAADAFKGLDEAGKELIEGTYFYHLISDQGEKHGFITIVR